MKVIVFCALFVSLSSANKYEDGKPAKLNCDCGWINLDSDKITYPWVVYLFIKKGSIFMTAGTILTEHHVLTAADVVEFERANTLGICVGSKDKTKCDNDAQKLYVNEIQVHPGYNAEETVHNVALIRTIQEIKFDKFVGPACFPHSNIANVDYVNTDLLFLGWGQSQILKRLSFKVKAQASCKKIYPPIKSDVHICAAPKTQQNVMGDGGGAFVMLDTDTQRYIVVGVLDQIYGKRTNPPAPTLLSNVANFRAWAENRVSRTVGVKLCKKTIT